jgi:hypothetical protein
VVSDEERNEAVAAHLRALDEELARLRKLGEQLDSRTRRSDEELEVLRRLEGLRAKPPPPSEPGGGEGS